MADVGWAGSWAAGGDDAAAGRVVLSGSSRRLFADVFGLVRFAAGCAGVGALEAEVGGSEDPDEGSGAGSVAGASAGIVKRVPKSASLTWWRLQGVEVVNTIAC